LENFRQENGEFSKLREEIQQLRVENSYLKGYATQITDRQDIWYSNATIL